MKYRKLKKKIKKDKYFKWNAYTTQNLSKKEYAKYWKNKFILRAAYVRRDRLYEDKKYKLRYQRWSFSWFGIPILAPKEIFLLQF